MTDDREPRGVPLSPRPSQQPEIRPTRGALRVVVPYAVVAGLWIWLSDALVGRIAVDPHRAVLWSTLKGLGFVAVTASLLGVAVSRQLRRLAAQRDAARALEEQVRRGQRLESIGQLAGGVAHDFNNILAAMMMQLELLRSGADLPPDVAAGLADLDREAQRAAALTRQLLLVSRRQALQVRRIDLGDTIAGLVRMLTRLVGEHIQTEFVHPAEPCWVDGDGGMLEQVVMNLCLNARDAMPKGGRLHVEVAPVDIGEARAAEHPDARAGSFACIRVSDTGEGMDAATLGRIFEPFFTTKEPGKGTGLGLATVYGIARQHQGWISVTSALSQGTTFEVFLPRVDGAGKESPAAAEDVETGRETILLAEDEPAVRKLASAALRRYGYRVLEAANGAEALERWNEHAGGVDLLVTDMVMPGGTSGLDLAAQLRAREPRLQVILVSGYSAEIVDQRSAVPEGVVFLAKPFRVGDLTRVVRECLDGRRDWGREAGCTS